MEKLLYFQYNLHSFKHIEKEAFVLALDKSQNFDEAKKIFRLIIHID